MLHTKIKFTLKESKNYSKKIIYISAMCPVGFPENCRVSSPAQFIMIVRWSVEVFFLNKILYFNNKSLNTVILLYNMYTFIHIM